MIRINLLPLRASKKKETIRQQVTIAGLSLVGVLLIGLCLWWVTVAKINGLNDQVKSSEDELRSLKSKIGTIDNIKKLQAEVKKKLDVLNQLRKEKTGPASRLAALSDAVPEKVWLTKYAESGNNVAVAGVAYNEDLLALFMRNLAASGSFTNVDLQVTEQVELGTVKAKKFDITFVIKPKQ